jgi:hypothetical protein
VQSRRAVWEISSTYPRVFGAAYRFPLDTVAVNRGLKDGRGRTLVVRAVDEPSGQMPVRSSAGISPSAWTTRCS